MAAKKEKGEPVIKKYKVLTPINGGEGNRLEAGEIFEANEDDAAELVAVGALAEA